MKAEIEIEGNLKVSIDVQNDEAHLIKLLKPTKNVIIPRYAKYNKKNYKIFFLEGYAFSNQQIESIEFPKNSNVLTIEGHCFSGTHLKKLQIPSSLISLKKNWCSDLYDLTDIEVSKKNEYLAYFGSKFLIGKESFKEKLYKNLYYSRFDIIEAEIPPFIKIVKDHSFHNHPYIKSIIFPENSELTSIQNFVIHSIPIERLVLPANLYLIWKENFFNTPNLVDIRVSQNNNVYQVLDDRCLYKKSDKNKSVFDILHVAPRDIRHIEIPSFVTLISFYAFYQCNKLESISFDSDSSLEIVFDLAFAYSTLQKKVVIPESVKDLRNGCFSEILTVESFEFRAKSIKFDDFVFKNCRNLNFILFPNATEIICNENSFEDIPTNAKIFVRKDAHISRAAKFYYIENFIDE